MTARQVLLIFLWIGSPLLFLCAQSAEAVEEQSGDCLACHQYEMTLNFSNGGTQALRVDPVGFENSVHKNLRCIDCHVGFSAGDHPKRTFKNKKQLALFVTESAKRCETCHPQVYETYVKSVHGAALLSEGNEEVPICSDCHSAHRIADPTQTDFRNQIPEMCSNCHADEALMKKYNLSTAVLRSYLDNFHGITLTFYKKEKSPVRQIAVCTDCHGVHDITKTKAPNSTVIKSNLLARCQKCHPGASENFPDSWISHYEPTLARAPLVYAINGFYKVFIPFMIIGLALHILPQLWHHITKR